MEAVRANRIGVKGRFPLQRVTPRALLLPILALSCAPAVAAPPSYSPVGSYTPSVAGVWDVARAGSAAGLAYTLTSGGEIHLQDAANSAGSSLVGRIDASLLSSFGPAFLTLSPDGSTIAIGDGNFGAGARVHFVSVSALHPVFISTTTSVAAANTSAHWASGATLYVSGSDATLGSVVTSIDAPSLDARVVVSNVGGASGGVVTDGQFLYTGNGFDFAPGGSDTGEVRAFSLAAITAAASSGAPLDFEAIGRPVADALSASSLAIDAQGNLFVGGGDFFGGSGDLGYAAAISGSAIQAALAGGPLAPDAEEQRVSPAGVDFYSVAFNAVTGEWLVGASGTIHRFAVPAPATVAFGALALGFTTRRRRHAN